MTWKRRRDRETDLDRELRNHIDLETEEGAEAGLPVNDAKAGAVRTLGNATLIKEDVRAAWGWTWIDRLRQDVRYALRTLVNNPSFAIVAVISLGLAIGANASIFGVINAILLKSLPVSHPDELVVFDSVTPAAGNSISHIFSYDMYRTTNEESHTLAAVFASAALRLNVNIDGSSEPTVQGQLVSGNYYQTLGVGAAAGRVILPEDDIVSNGHPLAVLSYTYWQRRFGADPSAVGKSIRLNGYPFTIAGVSSAEFFGTRPGTPVDISVPLAMQMEVMPDVGQSFITSNTASGWLELMGRRRPGVTSVQAQAELDGIYQRIMDQLRAFGGEKAKAVPAARVELEPGGRGIAELRLRYSHPLTVLMTIVGLVLVIACANIANLLLARATARRREMALRIAIGAGRRRLIRQLLTESVMIAVAGGAVGFLIAWFTSAAVGTLLIDENVSTLVAHPDSRVFLFTLAVTLLTGLFFGIVPAFATSQVDPHLTLKDARGASRSSGPSRGRALLVSAQVALSLMLLISAGLFVRTLMKLRAFDIGLDQEHILTLRLEPRGSDQKRDDTGIKQSLLHSYDAIVERVQTIPGVRAASLAGASPLGTEYTIFPSVTVPGYTAQTNEDLRVRMIQTFPDYFAALGVPLVAGRELAIADNNLNAPRVAVVNETFGKRFFGKAAAAVGRGFSIPGSSSPFTIVGVSRDVRDRGPRENVPPLIYTTYAQTPTGRGQMTLLVRFSGDPKAVVSSVRRFAQDMDPDMPLFEPQTISDRVGRLISQERLLATLSSLFGILALLLASIGLYGVMAYAVSRRQAEFGVRMALGATRGAVLNMVLKESFVLVGLGLAAGIPATLAATRFIANRLFGVTASDPLTLVSAIGLLIAVAGLAVWIPARRASKVDPIVALRYE